MRKLHYCSNGLPVTEQVVLYQKTKSNEDFLPIQEYYNNFKDYWYNQVIDFMDRSTFEGEFNYRLVRAVKTFREKTAQSIAKKKGYGPIGAFNGWFYKILANWKSNVKNSSFRLKKRPSIQCPICGRHVGRIDEEHLRHYKSTKDLPKYFVFKRQIFEVSILPKTYATTWGKKTKEKWEALQKGNTALISGDKRRCRWPWRLRNGKKGVMCPFTKKIISELSLEYIRTLEDKYSRYADPIDWELFVELYPSSLIQSDTYSLDFHKGNFCEDESFLRDFVERDHRMDTSMLVNTMTYKRMCQGDVPSEFEYVFHVIESLVDNEDDQELLKLIAIGYSLDDIADTLGMDKHEIRRRQRIIRERSRDLESVLCG